MSTYAGHGSKTTPQSKRAAKGQKRNTAGGYSFVLDEMGRLERFLILGTEGGTYYIGETKLTTQGIKAVRKALDKHGVMAVSKIVEISREGRAVKNEPAIVALAIAASHDDVVVRQAALSRLNEVCRTGTHLMQFASYVQENRGWGRGLRTAVSDWYLRDVEQVAYQIVKYRQREGWTHRDLLRKAHPHGDDEHNALFSYITHGQEGFEQFEYDAFPNAVAAYERLQEASSENEVIHLIETYPGIVTWEMLDTSLLGFPRVWMALLEAGMPMTAMIRNLGRMSANGALSVQGHGTKMVIKALGSKEKIKKARVHPLSVLVAMRTYASGHGVKGKLGWEPLRKIVDALDDAFYLAFDAVEPTGKNVMLALDVSSSMGWGTLAGMGISCAEGAAAMAMVTDRVEPDAIVMAFADEFRPLAVSNKQRLDDVIRMTSNMTFGGTDCSLPMLYADKHGLKVDAFIVYTDSETWAGQMHPHQALERYRQKSGIAAKLVVVGMEGNKFSIADPGDAGMLDVVGFDTSAPDAISAFVRE